MTVAEAVPLTTLSELERYYFDQEKRVQSFEDTLIEYTHHNHRALDHYLRMVANNQPKEELEKLATELLAHQEAEQTLRGELRALQARLHVAYESLQFARQHARS